MNVEIKCGIIGTLVSTIFCFTPLLLNFLALIGLSNFIAYVDYIVFPALLVFLFMIYIGFMRNLYSSEEDKGDNQELN